MAMKGIKKRAVVKQFGRNLLMVVTWQHEGVGVGGGGYC